jgi:hypothetical protein
LAMGVRREAPFITGVLWGNGYTWEWNEANPAPATVNR